MTDAADAVLAGPGGALSGRIDGRRHLYPVRVYYEDTDAGGVVYHASYLRYAERARAELLRLLGNGQGELMTVAGVMFVVRRCEIDYRAPARLDDMLEVASRVTEVGGVSMRIEHLVRRAEEVLTQLLVHIVCMSPDFKIVRLPPAIRDALIRLQDQEE